MAPASELASGAAVPAGDGRFDPGQLRLSQDFASTLGIKPVLSMVPVRTPNPQAFVRTHPSQDYYLETGVLPLKEERETYLVHPPLREALATEIKPMAFFTAIDRGGNVFLWPVRLPGADGRIDQWAITLRDAAEEAMHHWVRVFADRTLGGYKRVIAPNRFTEPAWPETTFSQLLRLAFRDHYIDSLEHPVVRRLRGEI